uniref:Envelope glycoprotein n=1 Tax=Mus cervicolor popaeus endogenous virus TaxID=153473 RepID=Q992L2_MULV|nr:envelope glycoprotein [Mus cervicolor popaeus endogenous virus]
MADSSLSEPSKDKTHSRAPTIALGILLVLGRVAQGGSPHQPVTLTWQVLDEELYVKWETSGKHPEWTWWPDLTPDLSGFSCDYSQLNVPDFYVCPGHGKSYSRRVCGGAESAFCAKWGCETTGDAYWNPNRPDLIIVKKGQNRTACKGNKCQGKYCNPLKITFTDQGKNSREWKRGLRWGCWVHLLSQHFIFYIRLQVTRSPVLAIGPNPVVADQKPPSRPAPVIPPVPPQVNPTGATDNTTGTTPTTVLSTKQPQRPGTGDRLLDLVQGAYLALNFTNPEKTQECWLCLVATPPYYEGVAVMGDYTNHTSPPDNCSSLPQHKLTLPEVSGQGHCIGNVPTSHQALCNKTESITAGSYYLAAPAGTLWACNTGLTPCVSANVLNLTSDYCVLTEIWPKVTYHPSEDMYARFEHRGKFKREPVSLTLALLLGGLTVGGIAAGIGTGATALTATQQFMQLQKAMHTDLQALEDSVTNLEKSLTSLSEVVLQNRRGLDLLFLKEGGLCAALKEECCFYADHTGLVRDSMAKLRERLKQRQKFFDSQQGWFEGIFNKSPWFTTLISTITGPLIILLLILFFGPCILNRIVQLIKDRVAVVQAMVLTQQYHQLRNLDLEEAETKE